MWYRRNLPHWQPAGAAIFLTWRLYGSLPATYRWEKTVIENDGHAFVEFDRVLDQAATGPKWLQPGPVAALVTETILTGAQKDMYQLHSFVVMPNHVHLLMTPLLIVAKITNWLKGITARQANLLLKRTGRHFWQDESFDHWVRSGREFDKIKDYIEKNPVKAGLVSRPSQWPYSSTAAGNSTASGTTA